MSKIDYRHEQDVTSNCMMNSSNFCVLESLSLDALISFYKLYHMLISTIHFSDKIHIT